MQNLQSIPRGTVLLVSGVASLAIAFIAYNYSFTTTSSTKSQVQNLQRSNAVRRRTRRRWREGVRRIELDHDPTERALASLRKREQENDPYGTYYVEWNESEDGQNQVYSASYGLLLSRLLLMHADIVHTQQLTEVQAEKLLVDIQSTFMQSFLRTEYPEGYTVTPDHRLIEQAMATFIPRSLVYGCLKLWDSEEANDIPAIAAERFNATTRSRNRPDATNVTTGETDRQQGTAPVVAEVQTDRAQNRSQGPGTGPNRTAADLAVALAAASGRDSAADEEDDHAVLDVLYRIAEEQAKRRGYQHRGVECNTCGMQPILGIRYHCANCYDYDLCEACESQQTHPSTHVFYKIRIPAPTRGQIKLVQPKWYPGQPGNHAAVSVPENVKVNLLERTTWDRGDIDALYDQFKCIASIKDTTDEDQINVFIGRRDFDRYFTTTSADRPSRPNELYERIFSFYARSSEDRISFKDFVLSMHELAHETTREARVNRLFHCFDRNKTGYVGRKDFLYLFRAHYELNKEIAKEIVFAGEDGILSEEDMLAAIHANNPISAAFAGNTFRGLTGRNGEGKHLDENGDLMLDEGLDMLQDNSDITGDRAHAIRREAAARARSDFISQGLIIPESEDTTPDDAVTRMRLELEASGFYRVVSPDDPSPSMANGTTSHQLPPHAAHMDGTSSSSSEMEHASEPAPWYNSEVNDEDVIQALGTTVSLDKITDVDQQKRVLDAQQVRLRDELDQSVRDTELSTLSERWQKRQFYLDEEEGLTKPEVYFESDDSDDESPDNLKHVLLKETKIQSRRASLRSRSSSKVRFDLDDEEGLDNRSDVSSRNTPLNERWGGVAFPQAREDTAVEIVYDTVQEAFNSMLDHFFKDLEDQAIIAQSTRSERQKHKALLMKYKRKIETRMREQATMLKQSSNVPPEVTKDTLINGSVHSSTTPTSGKLKSKLDPHRLPPTMSTCTSSDPTLPQNRPDEIDKATLITWLKHQFLEDQAEQRKGWAKLSKQEFKRKLRNDNSHEIDIGGEGEDDHPYWTEKADLGKFSHLSTWIEMASF